MHFLNFFFFLSECSVNFFSSIFLSNEFSLKVLLHSFDFFIKFFSIISIGFFGFILELFNSSPGIYYALFRVFSGILLFFMEFLKHFLEYFVEFFFLFVMEII